MADMEVDLEEDTVKDVRSVLTTAVPLTVDAAARWEEATGPPVVAKDRPQSTSMKAEMQSTRPKGRGRPPKRRRRR